MRDYHFDEAKMVMQELIEDVASRVRARKKWQERYILPLAIVMEGGVHKQYTLKDPTNPQKDIYKVVMHFADKLCNKQALYRTLKYIFESIY